MKQPPHLTEKTGHAFRTLALAAGIFILALTLRLPYIRSFLTADEINGASMAAKFLVSLVNRDWAGTLTLGYPSVTTSWLTILGVAMQWIFAPPADVATFAELANRFQANPLDMAILTWGRVGMILFAALCTAILWWLTRQLLGQRTAWLAAGILLFDPILLGYTRLVNPNPPLIHLLAITWLSMLWAVQRQKPRTLLFSGIAFGLAALAKTPALSLGPLVLFWIIWERWRRKEENPRWLRAGVVDLLWFGLPALATIGLLWPSLWVNPAGTIQRVWTFTFAMGARSHELGNFWLGKPQDPGILLYPAAFLWRTTPIVLIGAVLAALAFIKTCTSRRTIGAMLLLIIWYALILSLSPKKFDRYLFPTFPIIDILAAWGWLWLLERLFEGRRKAQKWRWTRGPILAAAALTLLQGAFAATNLPTYITAYNPLVGGLRTASSVMMVGWGEGLEEAARFLNVQPNAHRQRAASWYGYNVFQPFYHGTSYATFYGINTAADAYAADIDYIVTYVNQIQRQLLDASIRARLSQPLMTSQKGGVILASVYAWPKPFAHTIDRKLGPGLRLLGWEIAPYRPESGELQITLFWDADQMAAEQPAPVHAWMKDAAGEAWARTHEAQTPDPARQTQAWLEHRAVVQTMTLTPPPGLPPGPYRVELAPEPGETFLLETIDVPPTRASAVSDLQAHPLSDDVLFDDAIALIGYNASMSAQTLQLELLWEARRKPDAGIKYFVHVVDANDNILAQNDGFLGASAAQTPVMWQSGDLLRQRIAVPLPTNLPPDVHIYVGLYRAEGGQRLPLTVNHVPIPDARYPL